MNILYIYAFLLTANVFFSYFGTAFGAVGAGTLHGFIDSDKAATINSTAHDFETTSVVTFIGDLGKAITSIFKIVLLTDLSTFLTGILGWSNDFVGPFMLIFGFLGLVLVWALVTGRIPL